MSETKLLRCPFCGGGLRKLGSKRRGNQFFVHEYKGKVPDCILREFAFKTDDEEKIKLWNTRKQMQNIVERLGEYEDEAAQLGVGGMLADMLEIVKEEGGIDDR